MARVCETGGANSREGSSRLCREDEHALAVGDITLSQRVGVTLVGALVNTYVYRLRERGGSI